MKVSAKTKKQLDDALNRVIAQCPTGKQTAVLSDLYVMVNHETGELCVFDDDDRELCRNVVSEWKRTDADDVEREAKHVLQEFLGENRERIEAINFLRPFSFVMVDEGHEHLADLYLVDDDTVLIPGELMEGLEEDLDAFLKELMEK